MITDNANNIKEEAIPRIAQVGYFTKGILYSLIGFLGLKRAVVNAGESGGSKEALLHIGRYPLGEFLMILIGVGFGAYCIWRLVQIFVIHPENGWSFKAVAQRVGYFCSGCMYAGLAYWTFSFVFGSGSGDENSHTDLTAMALSHPLGRWAIIAVGLGYGAAALQHAYMTYKTSDFMKDYKLDEMSAWQRRTARVLTQFGMIARIIIFAIIGWFLFRTAMWYDPSQAKDMSVAFRYLLEKPYGRWLLAGVSLGFMSYGLSCFARVMYRRFLK